MCGEKTEKGEKMVTLQGSPPRVRGKGEFVFCALDGIGITPACAGKSSKIWEVFALIKDHPRVCGEKRR